MAFDTTTTVNKTGKQYLYTGRGPLDPKSLIETYAQLIDSDTWTENTSIIAYNGMIVAVWNDDDPKNNGIYFLHDSNVTSKFTPPEVTNKANWHKLGGINDLPGLAEQLETINETLKSVKNDVEELQDSATVVKENFSDFPSEGTSGKLYIATVEARTYVWADGKYLPVGDGAGSDEIEIQVICGGSATV